MTIDRNKVIEGLGQMLEDAARASVAKGAFYESGEFITKDTGPVWRSVAETLVNMVDIMIRDRVAAEAATTKSTAATIKKLEEADVGT